MSDTGNADFLRERNETYDSLISKVQKRLDAIPPPSASSLLSTSPVMTEAEAYRMAWTAIAGGLKHLKEGSPTGGQGLLSTATQKASLASTPFAKGFLTEKPVFKLTEEVTFDLSANGRETALFYSRNLLRNLEEDQKDSAQEILKSIDRAPALREVGAGAVSEGARPLHDAVVGGASLAAWSFRQVQLKDHRAPQEGGAAEKLGLSAASKSLDILSSVYAVALMEFRMDLGLPLPSRRAPAKAPFRPN